MMRSYLLSPEASSTVDREWGHSVVNLVNHKLDIHIDYVPPPSPERVPSKQHRATKRKSKQSATRANDLHPSFSLPSADAPDLFRARHQDPRIQTHRSLFPKSPEQMAYGSSDDRGENAASPATFYSRTYSSTNSLRLPEFLKRVFAPPNCCTPTVSSPERSLVSYRDHMTPRDNRRQREILNEAVFGPLSPDHSPGFLSRKSTSPPIIESKRSRRPTRRSASTEPFILMLESKNPLEIRHWQLQPGARQPASDRSLESSAEDLSETLYSKAEDAQSVSCPMRSQSHDLRMSCSCYSAVPILDVRGSELDFIETGGPSSESDSTSGAREAQMEADIRRFLESAPDPCPLTASQISQLCEQAESVEDVSKMMSDLMVVAKSPQKPKTTSSSSFFPRQTIGKLKRSENRRPLTVESFGDFNDRVEGVHESNREDYLK